MSTKHKISICIYFILFSSISAYSESDSLFFYLEITAKNNPLVLQKFNEYQAALQKVPQVGSLSDPDLSVGVFLSPMELISGKQVADIRLMQMFPWFGVLKNAKDEMSLMAKAKYESFRDIKAQVFFDAQRTWFEFQQMKEDIRVSEKNIGTLRILERLSMAKIKTSGANNSTTGPPGNTMGSFAGGTGLTDVYRIQIETGEMENNVLLLKNQQTALVTRFNSYLGRSSRTPVSLPDSLLADTLCLSPEVISDNLFTNNPALGMLQYEQQSIEARKKMVARMGYPMVGLGLNYSVIRKSEMSTSAMNGKDMVMPMITLTLPVYRKKYKAMENEAELMRAASAEGYKATANSLQVSWYEAWQNYQDAQRRILLYNKQRQLTQNTRDIMIRSFSASGSNLSDILRIHQPLVDYELKNLQAITDLNVSIALLKRLRGML